MKNEIKISANFGQDEEAAKELGKEVEELLKGIEGVKVKATTYRKCDFCQKKLEKEDKFETRGDLDICENCLENEKLNGGKDENKQRDWRGTQ